MAMDLPYQYVVVGGGAAGCPLAASLARKGQTLLLERGPAAVRNRAIRTCCNKDEVTWHRTEGGSWAATANVLGGGSAINAGVFIQESTTSQFFQAHPFLDSSIVRQAYADVTHAVSHKRPNKTQIGRDMVAAMKHIGLGKESVTTNTAHYGIYHPDSLFDESGIRYSAVDLLPQDGDSASRNLTIMTNILVSRIIFETSGLNPRPIGVEYQDLNETTPTTRTLLQPRAHYILSCGAIHTPRLLMLSGIGNAADLAKHNIPIVLHQPHVGRHLKDKAVIAISVSSSHPVAETVLDTMGATTDFNIGTATGGQLASYIGPPLLAMIPKHLRTPSARRLAARVLQLLPRNLRDLINQQITLYVTLSNPTSEGTVELANADVRTSPIIRTAGYQTLEEIEAAAKGLEIVSGLINSPSLSKYVRSRSNIGSVLLGIVEQMIPGSGQSHHSQAHKPATASPLTFPVLPKTDTRNPADRKKLQSWLNDLHAEGWTYTGTCRFDDVVNHDFSVKGIDSLSIVDASVLKRPTRVNQQATMMMLGGYAGAIMTAAP